MPSNRRWPAPSYISPEVVQPVVDHLKKRYGSKTALIHALLANDRGTSFKAWQKTLDRISTGDYVRGVRFETVEALFLEAEIDPPKPKFRQRIWRVTGWKPCPSDKSGRADLKPRRWGGNPINERGMPGHSVQTWYYITQKFAENRKRKLEEQGLFIEWAVAEADWQPLS